MANDQARTVVALDVGTSKVVALIGELAPDGSLELAGVGSHPSRGLKKGVVVDIESTVQAIQRAVEGAELMAGAHVDAVYVGIAGSHVMSTNSKGVVAVRDREVCQQDIDRVIDAAKAVPLSADQQVLHVLPQEYLIDNQEDVKDPLGMSGVRLEVRVHLVMCAVNAAQNVEKCVRRCGLEVNDIILEQLASGHATLSEDERDLGVCLVDIGGGTTDIAVFRDGAIRHTAVIPIAGDQVTRDIATGLHTPTAHAEEIKVKYACALAQLASPEAHIQVPGVGDRPARELARQTLAEMVEPRYEELFKLIQGELRNRGYEEMMAAGLVLTGGGAKMEGLVELAEEIFHMPVCLAQPRAVSGLTDIVRDPVYATSVGLLLYGRDQEQAGAAHRRSIGGNVVRKVRQWLHEHM